MYRHVLYALVISLNVFFYNTVNAETYERTATVKHVPRIGRSNSQNKNTNIDEMGKFFMKASKSVPRIGRRSENLDYQQFIEKKNQIPLSWSDVPDRVEYEPEVLMSPEILERMEFGDDPSAYIRMKRNANHKNMF